KKILPVKKRVLKTGRMETVSFSAEIAGGLRHYVLHVSRLENEEGVPPGITVIGSDVTDIRKTESQREAMSNRLEHMKRYESMAVMAEGISHDFNNLLSGVFGYIDLAHDSSVDPKTRQYISKALTTIDRARSLTQDLVTYAKGGAPQKAAMVLGKWLQNCVLSVIESRPVKLEFNIEADLPGVLLDDQQMTRGFEVFIVNAYQAAAELDRKAKVKISAKQITVSDREVEGLRGGSYVKISVADNGGGVSESVRDKIFEPYFSTRGKGRGLGLATSFSIIQHHDGALLLESSKESGSVFSIYLPALQFRAPVIDKTNKKGDSVQRLLLMDDDEFILDAFSDVLISLGYSVKSVKNGRDALDVISKEHKEQPFSAIILDLHVENGAGALEVIGEIRTLVGDLPVFVSCGALDNEVMVQFQRFGFTDKIDKPYKRKELLSVLRNHIGRH
ncbi:MAG: ATP-binding protein, partial [Bacteroidota bacterium]